MMNKQFISPLILSLFLFFATAWKGESPQKNSSNYTIYCQGQCSDKECGLTGVIGSNNDYVQCSCSNCNMIVEQEKSKEKVTQSGLNPELKSLASEIQAFLKYMAKKYNTSDYIITSIDFNSDENSQATTFNYKIAGEKAGSVMYARIGNGPITQIDCNATKCDCREKWIFSSPPHAECTCQEDCKMTVTEIKE